jgi:hypothetical protein
MRIQWRWFSLALVILLSSALLIPMQKMTTAESPHKIYVTLGFHTSFYHSWRGDTPDEAGFGTDIRLVRSILDILNDANEQGLDARGYWDFDVYWTLEQIIPEFAPDLIDGIRARIETGADEIVAGPYNNGANHAATPDELRVALEYALENPYGSGLKQLFGEVAPYYRPQEAVYTPGTTQALLDAGFEGVILYYSDVPFNSISAMIPALPPEQRYNPLWMRSRPEEPPIILLPAISPADLVNSVSLEKLMLNLRKLQTSGEVNQDMLIHINFDTDSETWLPLEVPRLLSWFPNAGGLMEYIRAVNKYDWSAFTLPSEYMRNHQPQGEVLVRQDLADGGFDGNYSWAEKYTSLQNWSKLERSRLHSYRAMELGKQVPQALQDEIQAVLWEGEDSSFFQRQIGLSTTHFGMSTPVINEERQAKADALLSGAERIALSAEKEAAVVIRSQTDPQAGALYVFEVYDFDREGRSAMGPVQMPVRVPLIMPDGVEAVIVREIAGKSVQASLINQQSLPGGGLSAELLFVTHLAQGERKTFRVDAAPAAQPGQPLAQLSNRWLDLMLSNENGVDALLFEGQQIGGSEFLDPFITYKDGRRNRRWDTQGYAFADLTGEAWDGLQRARLLAEIPMNTPKGRYTSEFEYTFSLLNDLPYLIVDVEAHYTSTPPRDIIHTLQQKLRRMLDLNWVEVAPFQLNPDIHAPGDDPLRVWKHNYLGITSYYDLDYGQINPINRNLDSFNHQVTAGWVAVSNGDKGLLIGENAEVLSSMAFAPMRLREIDGTQHLSINPFGSYHGKQIDYSHLGGLGIGADITVAASGSLRPNGPSYNGQTVRFSLLLAPYTGDEPPQALQDSAAAFFYPPGVVYLQTPETVSALLPDEIRAQVAAAERIERLNNPAPLLQPAGFLANPSDAAIELVWDLPRDERVSGFEIRWRNSHGEDWQHIELDRMKRWIISDLVNGHDYTFQLRALSPSSISHWTPLEIAKPGPVGMTSLASAARGVSTRTVVRLIYHSLAHQWDMLWARPEMNTQPLLPSAPEPLVD